MRFASIGRALMAAVSVLTAVNCASATSQTTATGEKTPTYEVASVKQNLNPNPAWRMNFTTDGVSAQDVTLEYAIHEAFGVYDDRLWSGGPGWIREKRFDISAKFDLSKYPKPTLDQRRAMLQQLLADRFKLEVHHESKDFPLYALVIAKHGPLFEETKEADLQRSAEWGVMCTVSRGGRGLLEMSGCTTRQLADHLAGNRDVGRKVVDKTELTGHYNFSLHWTPVDPSPGLGTNGIDSGGGSIFTAVKEQLGLELKPTSGPLDTIMIDHVEMPSEN